jgi:hypothetical protein
VIEESQVIESQDVQGWAGCKHPDFNKSENQLRAAWTEYEVNYVGKWCEENSTLNPSWAKSIVSKCVKHIKATPEVREHFHPIHIFDSSRLRHGLETYLLKRK